MTVISVIIAIILLIAVPIMAMRLINGISRRASIQEEAYLELNGIKQFVRIRCEDGANPVMIFIHGVPASPMGSRPALVRCVPLMSISTHGGVWRMATKSLRCLFRKPKL